MSIRVVKSSWYNYPSVAVDFVPGDLVIVKHGQTLKTPLSRVLIGIVTVYDSEANETKSYIGLATGENQSDDERHIIDCGVPFYGV